MTYPRLGRLSPHVETNQKPNIRSHLQEPWQARQNAANYIRNNGLRRLACDVFV